MNDDSLNIFIPGGPCISGQYWDYFLQKSQIQGIRLTHSNHENKYNPNRIMHYEQLVQDAIETITELSKESINLIGHSFGSWIALELVRHNQIRSRINKVSLVSLPFYVTKSDKIINEFNKHHLDQIRTNEDFQIFWEKVLHLYTNDYEVMQGLKRAGIYFEGNENINISQAYLSSLLSTLTDSKNIALIYGDKDQITPPPDKLTYSLISGASHFPMLERTETFTEVLLSTLK